MKQIRKILFVAALATCCNVAMMAQHSVPNPIDYYPELFAEDPQKILEANQFLDTIFKDFVPDTSKTAPTTDKISGRCYVIVMDNDSEYEIDPSIPLPPFITIDPLRIKRVYLRTDFDDQPQSKKISGREWISFTVTLLLVILKIL